VAIGELQGAIEKTRKQHPRKALEIEFWLGRVVESFNVLPMDVDCFVNMRA
jgi:hypothetical protein